jgi:hypothetical protein
VRRARRGVSDAAVPSPLRSGCDSRGSLDAGPGRHLGCGTNRRSASTGTSTPSYGHRSEPGWCEPAWH